MPGITERASAAAADRDELVGLIGVLRSSSLPFPESLKTQSREAPPRGLVAGCQLQATIFRVFQRLNPCYFEAADMAVEVLEMLEGSKRLLVRECDLRLSVKAGSLLLLLSPVLLSRGSCDLQLSADRLAARPVQILAAYSSQTLQTPNSAFLEVAAARTASKRVCCGSATRRVSVFGVSCDFVVQAATYYLRQIAVGAATGSTVWPRRCPPVADLSNRLSHTSFEETR